MPNPTSFLIKPVLPVSTLLGTIVQTDPDMEIRFSIGLAATQNSTNVLPSGAYAYEAQIEITTPYSVGATITVGQSGALSSLMGTGDNNPQVANLYTVRQDTALTPAIPIAVTVAGAPSLGAGVCIVRYVVPLP